MSVWYKPSETEVKTILQHSKDIYIKVELLNRDLTLQDTLEGNMINDSFTIDSESKQRRTYSCDMYVSDATFLVGEDKKIWIDKYIRVYYGIKNSRIRDVVWWVIGTFTYLNANYKYSGTDNTLSLSCADMMANFDGTKNGQITVTRDTDFATIETYNATTGYKFLIPAGTPIKQAVISLLTNAKITEYQIEDYPEGRDVIPYDLEYTNSLTYNDVWNDICELYPGWEYYFDEMGKFIWRRIPTGGSGADNERIMMTNELIDKLYVDESVSDNFTGIYNVTEVWGKTLDLDAQGDRYASSSSYNASTNTYTVTIDLIPKHLDGKYDKIEYFFDNLDKIAVNISAKNVADKPKLVIKGNVKGENNQTIATTTLPSMDMINDDGSYVKANTFLKGNISNSIYVFTYRQNYGTQLQNVLYLNGQTQCFGRYEETSEDCPFSTTRLGYQIVNRKNYEKLWSDDLCLNQAEYDTYQTTQMQETVELTTVIIPWIDVSQKVSYIMQQAEDREARLASGTDIPEYIIKSISWSSFDGTMRIVMYRFRPSLEFVKYNNK